MRPWKAWKVYHYCFFWCTSQPLCYSSCGFTEHPGTCGRLARMVSDSHLAGLSAGGSSQIMWFFRPYQVVAEVWRGSNPDMLPDIDWKSGAVSALLGWWWGLWVIHNLFALGASVLDLPGVFDGDATPSSGALQLELLSTALAIPTGVLAILVVLRITRRQEVKRSRILAG